MKPVAEREIKGTRLALIGAMQDEIALFLEGMEGGTSEEIAGISFYSGRIEGEPVVVCRSGVGKVNSALCTQILADRFQVKKLIFTGVAGALDPELDIGDIVISTSCQQHDVNATALGFDSGMIPYQEVSIFKADPRLIRMAEAAARKVCPGKVATGKILSGDQFIADPEEVRRLRVSFAGTCVEMEGAAVAHVCYQNRIPFVIIRSMSDRADFDADVNFAEFSAESARRSNDIVQRMLRNGDW